MKKFLAGTAVVILILVVWSVMRHRAENRNVPSSSLTEVLSLSKNSPEKASALAMEPGPSRLSFAPPKAKTPALPSVPPTVLPSIDDLPKISDAQKLKSGNTEQMPANLLAKIQPLIRMNRLVKENPNIEPAALGFYESCATREDLMNAVRARCLNHLRSLARKRGESVDLSRYSARLIRLSEFINL